MNIIISVRRSFTLIELLIVISILAILAGIVLVVLNPTKQGDKARNSVILSTMDKLTLSLEANYNADFAYPTYCPNLAALNSNINCNGNYKFSVSGITLPKLCQSNGYKYGGTSQCYFYYYNGTHATRSGCIFVTKYNNDGGGWYYVARYGTVMAAKNWWNAGCDKIQR